MNSKKTYSVLIIDNFHMDPEYDYVIEGFSTKEIAIEFARRWLRSSVEHQRKSNADREELKLL